MQLKFDTLYCCHKNVPHVRSKSGEATTSNPIHKAMVRIQRPTCRHGQRNNRQTQGDVWQEIHTHGPETVF